MILFPAIDLKDGQCVRLRQGEMAEATVFNPDPAAQARTFEDQGFDWLHVVDLNGAFEGKPVNEKAVEDIFNAVHISIQLGGGIRDLDTIVTWLEKGVDRVILGTAAVCDPALVREAARDFPGCIAVGIDARDGKVAIDFGVYGAPETYLVDRDGIIRFKQIGPLTREIIEKKIMPLVSTF